MAKKKDEQEYGDIIQNHELIKRTLMVAAFPGLIKEVVKKGKKTYEGFLPGFEFAQVDNIADENECVETLQDMLDDEVEELVVFGKSLPYVDEDDVLMEKYPDHKIVYLDINVYATAEELEYYDSCNHDCAHCSTPCDQADWEECDCGCEDDCDCEDECDCDDEDCDCHEHNHHHHHDHHDHHCSCGCEDEDDDECCCGDHEGHECHCHEEGDHECHCHEENKEKTCKCNGEGKKEKGKNCKSKK